MKHAIRLIGLLLLAQCTAAHAALIQWSYAATIQTINQSDGPAADAGLVEGAVIHGRFVFDTELAVGPDQISGNSWYYGAIVGAFVAVGGLSATLDTSVSDANNVVVRNDSFDAVGANTSILWDSGVETTAGGIGIQFVAGNGLLVDDQSFPALPDFTQIDDFDGPIAGGSFLVFSGLFGSDQAFGSARIDAVSARVVPLPAAVYLLGGGLLALSSLRRR